MNFIQGFAKVAAIAKKKKKQTDPPQNATDDYTGPAPNTNDPQDG